MKIKIQFILIAAMVALLGSCQKEEQLKEIDAVDPTLKKATELLSGNIILGQRVKMSNVDKTLLPDGAPTKYTFTWKEKEKKMQIYLEKIKPGTMPFPISMTSEATFMELNTWEKDEYTGEGWVKFFDDKAEVTAYQEDYPDPLPKPDGSAVLKGYLNVNTHEIEFLVNYNMMNVTGHVFKQKVDKSRTNYEEELSVFEEGLCIYKLDHSLSHLLKAPTEKAIALLGGNKTLNATLNLNGKAAAKADALPLVFTWDGSEAAKTTGRMAVKMAKTAVNDGAMQLSFEASARWLDLLTWAEERKYGNSNTEWIKMKATGVKIILWSADGSKQTAASDKGELRMIVNVKQGKTTFSLKDHSLKLEVDMPLSALN